MTQTPPAPIMRSNNALEAHPYLPAWIAKYWPGGKVEYPAGQGLVRRPDVVIVNDGSAPPTQPNIKNIVEIKFPPQTKDPEQDADHALIAGGEGKVVTMGPADCDCSNDDGGESPLRVAAEKLSALGRSLRQLMGATPPSIPGLGGMPLRPAPLPIP